MSKMNKKNKAKQPTLTWLVVKFDKENAVEAIPERWYVQGSGECFWPPSNCSTKKTRDYIKCSEAPKADWRHYPVSILGRYDNLVYAQQKAEKAQNTSDLSSNEEAIRDRSVRRTQKYTSPKKVLSDIESLSDTTSTKSDSDTNEYPSTRDLTGKKAGRVSLKGREMSTVTARPFADPIEKVAHTATTDDTADETKKFRKLILREISGMQLKLDDLANSVTVLLQSKRLENARCMPPDDVPDIIHSFPVDEKCLMDLEHWLESNAEHKKHLAQELSRIGGSTVKEVTRRIMYRVFSNEVGAQYSWEGAKKKKPFKKLAVASAILSAVRLSKTALDSNEAEVIGYIKAWLVRCKDRINNAKSSNKVNTTVDETVQIGSEVSIGDQRVRGRDRDNSDRYSDDSQVKDRDERQNQIRNRADTRVTSEKKNHGARDGCNVKAGENEECEEDRIRNRNKERDDDGDNEGSD